MIRCTRGSRLPVHFVKQKWKRRLPSTISSSTRSHHNTSTSSSSSSPAKSTSTLLYNSLTSSIESLPNDKPFACYTCGPTVYAPAHLGHARTYVWVDVLRRLVEHQQSSCRSSAAAAAAATTTAPILFVMNITNVDDKILAASSNDSSSVDPLDLASRLEAEFWRDMDALNVLRPHIVVRVTDHVDSHIVPFIDDLLQHEFAAERDDGIYFKVADYERKTGKTYLQFQRGGGGGERLGASDMSDDTDNQQQQLQQRDFCLWKRQKPGEALVWKGPRNMPGRPGWHIECSAMIRAVQDQIQPVSFQLHIGGVDLQFPHHVNEIAQSEALAACCPKASELEQQQHWIPHWMHTGHLHIDGLKMSKSLKNFITIEDYLQASATDSPWSSPADDFRWWCLQSSYRGPSTFTQLQINQARDGRMEVIRFLVEAQERMEKPSRASRWSSDDRDMLWTANEAYQKCLQALNNDMDGHTFCRELLVLIDRSCAYLRQSTGVSVEAIQAVQSTVRDLCALVGFSDVTCGAGLRVGDSSTIVAGGEHALLDAVVQFRAAVRRSAMAGLKSGGADDATLAKDILALCDDARDTTFRRMGVELLDNATSTDGHGVSSWKPCLPVSEEGDGHAEIGSLSMSANLRHRELVSVPIEQFFKVGIYEGQFIEFDEEGLPTVKADGSQVSNRERKKLQKKFEKHRKRLETTSQTMTPAKIECTI